MTKTEHFECRVPAGMTDEEALEIFQDNQDYGWVDADDTDFHNIEFEVNKGNPKHGFPHDIKREA